MLISKLSKNHNRKSFDCGVPALNNFIQRLASQVVKRFEATIYIAHDGDTVAGYYSISSFHIHKDSDPDLLKKQSPHVAIPCVLIGRLAVDNNYKGQGLGGELLLHAMKTIKQLSEIVGVALVVVDAKDENAKRFYESYGFIELVNNPLTLCFPVKQIPH